MNFAEELNKIREKRGLTIEQVAVISGYSYPSIANFCAGRALPPERARQPLLDAIDVAFVGGRKAK